MESVDTDKGILRGIDWPTVVIYLVLVVAGALSIYAASYDFDRASLFDMSEFSGKQFLWIGLGLVLGLTILLMDWRIFETMAMPIYVLVMLVLVVTIFIAPDIQGSRSWLVFGSVSLQPAEFAKFATALALAWLFGGYGFSLNARASNYIKALSIIFLPVCLIIAQRETGSALVFLSLFFVLYREGMSGLVLLAASMAVVFFVVAVKYSAEIMPGVSPGEIAIIVMLMLMAVAMVATYARERVLARNLVVIFLLLIAFGSCALIWEWHMPIVLIGSIVLVGAMVYALLSCTRTSWHKVLVSSIAVVAGLIFMYSVNFVFADVLKPYQQMRIKVLLGMEKDLLGVGYNVNQSTIAIGSGGWFGKGFLNGTQTKLKYVPEQHTDFIFCTIGEEEGFFGSAIVLALFLALILRVIAISERQPTTFGRVYGYCVASYLLLHLIINIGMVIGLCPVIGIPLPFFSYGGSSLWGFTILLFILLRLDSSRRR